MASKGNFFALQFNHCKRRKLRGSSNESTSKQAKNAQKQEAEDKEPKHFKQAKEFRHLEQGHGKVSYTPFTTYLQNLNDSKAIYLFCFF